MRLKYPAKPLIGFEDAKIVHTIASGTVEEDKGGDDLFHQANPGSLRVGVFRCCRQDP